MSILRYRYIADDNTSYAMADDINGVIASLEKGSKALLAWFENNLLKCIGGKYNLLVSSIDTLSIKVSEYDIKNSDCEKLLGVQFDNKLTFEKHIPAISRKANIKTYALTGRMVKNVFFNSLFKYCLLTWMCLNHPTNRKINRVHERCLRLISNDKLKF